MLLDSRGWELAADRWAGVSVGVLAGGAALVRLARGRSARVALWVTAGGCAVSVLLTSVVGYPGLPGPAARHHDGHYDGRPVGGVSVTDLRTPPVGGSTRRIELVARAETITLPSGRTLEAWTFGSLPGPTLTARVGETLEVTLRNRNIAEGVTVHWHGLQVPNGEDGVAGVTQDAVLPGESFRYRIQVEQPGTFWYHTHQRGREGIGRGLYGALIVQPAAGPEPGVDLAVPVHTVASGALLGGRDVLWRETAAPGTPVRLRLINTDQQPRRLAVNGTAFRVRALDGVDLIGPTAVVDQALRVPAGGRYDLAFVMPSGPVRLTVEGARRTGLLLAVSADMPDPGGSVPSTTFDPTTYGAAQPVPGMTGPFTVSATLVLDRLPRLLHGRPALAQTVNGGTYPDIPPLLVSEGDLVRLRVVNRSFETHPMHLHGHHVLVLSVNGRAPSGSPLWLDTFDVRPGEVWEVALRADTRASGWTIVTILSTPLRE